MSNSTLVKKFHDISKFVIWGEKPADNPNAKAPTMTFSFRDGNPRFVVYTGLTGPEGVITFPSDYPTMVATIMLLKDIIKGQPGEKVAVDSLAYVYKDNAPTTEKRVVSTLYIGKSKDGLIYFSVISENRPKIVFTIKPSPFHAFRDGEKNIISEAMISERMATGLADMILNIISNVIVNYSDEEYRGGKKQLEIKPYTGKQGNNTANNTIVKGDIIDDLESLGL